MHHGDTMLGELQRLHAEILARLDEMDELTARPQPPMDRLPAARHALTRASRARTILLERVYDRLITEAEPDRRSAIEALKAESKAGLISSTEHIGSWTLREIASRWPEYCAASAVMRAKMRERIKNEVRLIYPLLSLP